MSALQSVKMLLDELNKKRNELLEQLEILEDEIELPRLKALYEGKYFKYDNGYDKATRWPIYSFCFEVQDRFGALADSFESTPDDFAFAIRKRTEFSTFQTEISRDEYLVSVTSFIESVQQLHSNTINP